MLVATETFRYPRRFKAMTAVSGVVFAALGVMLLTWLEIGPVRHTELFVAIILTISVWLAWCVTMFRRADDEVVLDDSSIAYRVPGRSTVILSWPEVTGVRAFARSPGSMLLSLHWPLIFVLVSAWYWHQGGSPYGVLFCVAWGLWTLLAPPWRVRLRDDAVAVDWLGWSRKIPYTDIVAVRIRDLKGIPDKETTGGVATVMIETVRGGARSTRRGGARARPLKWGPRNGPHTPSARRVPGNPCAPRSRAPRSR